MQLFLKEIQHLGQSSVLLGIQPLPSKTHAIQKMSPQQHPNKSDLPWVGRILQEIYQRIRKNRKPLILLTRQQVKFNWTPEHQEPFIHLKEAIFRHPSYTTPTQTKLTSYMQMLPMMPAEHSSLKNTMELSSQ